jgi:hypothetical protein
MKECCSLTVIKTNLGIFNVTWSEYLIISFIIRIAINIHDKIQQSIKRLRMTRVKLYKSYIYIFKAHL